MATADVDFAATELYVRGLWRINQSRNAARLYNYAACSSMYT